MRSRYIRINITLPAKSLKEIDDFCLEEKLTRSQLIREASLDFISGRTEMKMQNRVYMDRKEAMKMAEEFRQSSSMENGGKIIRKFRDERKLLK